MPTEERTGFETKKHEILKAAQGLFSRYGLAKTTLDDIARAVGMKKTSLYHYYENKEAIFSEVITVEIDELLRAIDHNVSRTDDAPQKLLAYMQARVEYMRSLVNLHGLAAQVILEVRPIIETLYTDLRRQETALLKNIIEEGIAHGAFRPCDVEEVADAMLAVVHSIELMAVQDATNLSRTEIDYDAVERRLAVILRLIGDGMTCRHAASNTTHATDDVPSVDA